MTKSIKNKNKSRIKLNDSSKLSSLIMKSSMIFVLAALISTAMFLGAVDFVTPKTLTTFNVENLNGRIITYAKSDELSSFDSVWNLFANANKLSKTSSAFNNISRQTAYLGGDGEINKNNKSESEYTAKLFGIFPIKRVDITVFSETHLIPGGLPFGVRFYTEGVIVVGTSEIETEKGTANPGKNAGVKTSDIIVAVNGAPVSTSDEVARLIEASKGETISISIVRDGKSLNMNLKPALSNTEKKYKSGIWLRDSAAGIGTITFINPENNSFGGLGHGICDIDTGSLMPLRRGSVVNTDIDAVIKGKSEVPGELKGKFKDNAGTLFANTKNGVFGILTENLASDENFTPLPIGLRSDIKEGKASIFSTVDDTGIKKFDIEIIKIYKNSSDSKNFLVKITDPELLEITGGIVQGMSGSPIIQDGKIIGAITHVLVSDPSKGYGIFIDNMLDSMPEVLKTE